MTAFAPYAAKYMIRYILTIITLSVFSSNASSNEEYLLFSENLDNIIEVDGFTTCSEYELDTLELTTAECTTRRNEANLYCSQIVKTLEPNKLTHDEWKHRMSYFHHCRMLVFSGCQYDFELTDLVNVASSLKDEAEITSNANRFNELLKCETF